MGARQRGGGASRMEVSGRSRGLRKRKRRRRTAIARLDARVAARTGCRPADRRRRRRGSPALAAGSGDRPARLGDAAGDRACGIDAVRRSRRSSTDGHRARSRCPTPRCARGRLDSSDELKQAIAFAQEQIGGSPASQRETLVDFEVETLPGVRLGQRQIPVRRVGAYIPAGRVPMLATPFMTVLVAKVAGVETVVACSPPRGGAAGSTRRCCTRSRPLAPTASSRLVAFRRWPRWHSGSRGLSRST